MAINPAPAEYRLLPKAKPDFIADTLAEATAEVAGEPETFEGKYYVALDQAAGAQLYLVESGELILVKQPGWVYEAPDRDDPQFYNPDGTPVEGAVGVMWFDGALSGAGELQCYATDDGTAGGVALFSAIKSVDASNTGNQALIERAMYCGATVAGASVVARFLRGATVLIGGSTVRAAAAGTLVRVRVEGTLA